MAGVDVSISECLVQFRRHRVAGRMHPVGRSALVDRQVHAVEERGESVAGFRIDTDSHPISASAGYILVPMSRLVARKSKSACSNACAIGSLIETSDRWFRSPTVSRVSAMALVIAGQTSENRSCSFSTRASLGVARSATWSTCY